MDNVIRNQIDLLHAAREFERRYPGRFFNVTSREWYNDAWEIRAWGSVAKKLVERGQLECAQSENSAGNSKVKSYRIVNDN